MKLSKAGYAFEGLIVPPESLKGVGPDAEDLKAVTVQVRKDLDNRRTADSLETAGILELAAGHSDASVKLLEEAAAGEDAKAGTHNNLAVAYLNRATDNQDPYDILLSLSQVDEALKLYRSSAVGLSNRALILDKLELRRQAQIAWYRFLSVNDEFEQASDSGALKPTRAPPTDEDDWPSQSRSLEAAVLRGDEGTARQVVERFSQPVRQHVEQDLFPEWALSIDSRKPDEISRDEQLVQQIGALLASVTGDRLIQDAAQAVSSASGRELSSIAEGHIEYAHGLKQLNDGSISQAKALFEKAYDALSRAESPFADWALFQVAVCSYHQKAYGPSLEIAHRLCHRAKVHNYRALLGRASWLIGLIDLDEANPAEAIKYLEESVACFEEAKERGNQAFVHSLTASAFEYLGEPRQAWKHRDLALHAAVQVGDIMRLPAMLGEAAQAASKEGLYGVALAYQDEAVWLAHRRGNPLAISEAHWWRGLILQHAENPERALREIARAKAYCLEIPDGGIRRHTQAGIEALEGALLANRDPALAIRDLNDALSYYEHSFYRYPVIEVLLNRGLSFEAAYDLADAKRDFLAGVSEYESQSRSVSDMILRYDYFEQARKVFDELVNLNAFVDNPPELSFDSAERAKARVLWDALKNQDKDKEPFDHAWIEEHLSPGTVLVAYYVLPDRTLAWVLDKQNVAGFSLPIREADLDASVRGLRDFVMANNLSEFKDSAESLYRKLIAPLESRISGFERIVFIPDRELNALPFGALLDHKTGHYLIQDHEVVIAPSASVYISAEMHARSLPGLPAPEGVVVGDPVLSRSSHPSLSSLPLSKLEAEHVASLFPGSSLLLGADATRSRFLQEIDKCDFVHYAGHYLANSKVPFFSRLVLSPYGAPDSGDLTARDVYDLTLKRPRLAFLAGCETASEGQVSLEGGTDIARAFLAAGVPSVVAFQWNLGDRESQVVSSLFYDGLSRSRDTLSALRSAQVDCINSRDLMLSSPRTWAGVELLGSPVKLLR